MILYHSHRRNHITESKKNTKQVGMVFIIEQKHDDTQTNSADESIDEYNNRCIDKIIEQMVKIENEPIVEEIDGIIYEFHMRKGGIILIQDYNLTQLFVKKLKHFTENEKIQNKNFTSLDKHNESVHLSYFSKKVIRKQKLLLVDRSKMNQDEPETKECVKRALFINEGYNNEGAYSAFYHWYLFDMGQFIVQYLKLLNEGGSLRNKQNTLNLNKFSIILNNELIKDNIPRNQFISEFSLSMLKNYDNLINDITLNENNSFYYYSSIPINSLWKKSLNSRQTSKKIRAKYQKEHSLVLDEYLYDDVEKYGLKEKSVCTNCRCMIYEFAFINSENFKTGAYVPFYCLLCADLSEEIVTNAFVRVKTNIIDAIEYSKLRRQHKDILISIENGITISKDDNILTNDGKFVIVKNWIEYLASSNDFTRSIIEMNDRFKYQYPKKINAEYKPMHGVLHTVKY